MVHALIVHRCAPLLKESLYSDARIIVSACADRFLRQLGDNLYQPCARQCTGTTVGMVLCLREGPILFRGMIPSSMLVVLFSLCCIDR